VGRPARAAALARRAAPLPESGQHYTSSASSGVWTAAGGRWAVASAASFGRLVGETKGTSRPAKRGGQGNSCLSAVASFDWPSITSSPPPQRLRIGGVASRFDRFPPASPAKSDARSSPPPPRRVTCGVPAPPVRDSRSADGDRRPAVCPSVGSTRRCLTENPAPACYPDHATRTNAAGTRAKLKIQMETK